MISLRGNLSHLLALSGPEAMICPLETHVKDISVDKCAYSRTPCLLQELDFQNFGFDLVLSHFFDIVICLLD